MMLVLILVAAGVVLGFAYLSSAALKAQVATSYSDLSRARYLAESGVNHGVWTLRFEPDSIVDTMLGPYYADGTEDYYFVTAQEVPGNDGYFQVTAIATVDGVQRSSAATVYRTAAPQVEVSHGLLVGSGFTWSPSALSIDGDVHVNDMFFNMADIDGNASASSFLWDPWGHVSGATEQFADHVELPPVSSDQYADGYTFGSIEHTPAVHTERDWTQGNPLNGGAAVTADNMGGVVKIVPEDGNDAVLHDNVDFTGTLIIEGNLYLNGRNINLSSVEGFPALIVTGKVYVTNSARNVTISGLVCADGGIESYGHSRNASTTINGAVVSKTGGYSVSLYGDHQLNFEASLARVYDMTLPPQQRAPSVKIVDWND
jgi:hypothetical protein